MTRIMIDINGTTVEVLDEHPMSELPAEGHLMTVTVTIPPRNPGTPAHRHSGPVYGYMLEGEMIFELEGDPPVVMRPGDTIWEPGGDRIHYQAANPGDTVAKFVVVMACKAGEEMLTFVEPAELEARKHLRHSGPVVDPRAVEA
ncbi:cupin domain-containing protein [Pseudonocardia sp. N23]|uniref:cupin domain-containing protein n=1 Tax=Pseudonocardia sp. N23 TaxID=1987376 RepID=UPI00209C5654|nr:cupin domain-containing protein [Pseudonocardia sp. N23]